MPRPRSEEAHRKVIEAAISLFADRGLEATSMDAIAEVSGVSKATIYKHWPNKDSLSLEVVGHLAGADTRRPTFDSGDLHADLVAQLSFQPAEDRKNLRERIMPHIMAYAGRNPVFGKAWRNRALSPAITALMEWIYREQQRGKLHEAVNLEVATALLMGPLLLRNILGRQGATVKTAYAAGLEVAIADGFLALYATPGKKKRQ